MNLLINFLLEEFLSPSSKAGKFFEDQKRFH